LRQRRWRRRVSRTSPSESRSLEAVMRLERTTAQAVEQQLWSSCPSSPTDHACRPPLAVCGSATGSDPRRGRRPHPNAPAHPREPPQDQRVPDARHHRHVRRFPNSSSPHLPSPVSIFCPPSSYDLFSVSSSSPPSYQPPYSSHLLFLPFSLSISSVTSFPPRLPSPIHSTSPPSFTPSPSVPSPFHFPRFLSYGGRSPTAVARRPH